MYLQDVPNHVVFLSPKPTNQITDGSHINIKPMLLLFWPFIGQLWALMGLSPCGLCLVGLYRFKERTQYMHCTEMHLIAWRVVEMIFRHDQVKINR